MRLVEFYSELIEPREGYDSGNFASLHFGERVRMFLFGFVVFCMKDLYVVWFFCFVLFV